MPTMIIDPSLEASLKAQRRRTGADRYDEVWEGIYMMAPMPNTEHQQIVARFVSIFEEIVGWPGLGLVVPGVNLSDQEVDWHRDYRVPDVALALADGKVRDLNTHWLGGADLIVEVLSPDDQTRQKLPFYSRIGVREVILIDRNPWSVELYQPRQSELQLAGRSTVDDEILLTSAVLPLTLRLVRAPKRPLVEVDYPPSGKNWRV